MFAVNDFTSRLTGSPYAPRYVRDLGTVLLFPVPALGFFDQPLRDIEDIDSYTLWSSAQTAIGNLHSSLSQPVDVLAFMDTQVFRIKRSKKLRRERQSSITSQPSTPDPIAQAKQKEAQSKTEDCAPVLIEGICTSLTENALLIEGYSHSVKRTLNTAIIGDLSLNAKVSIQLLTKSKDQKIAKVISVLEPAPKEQADEPKVEAVISPQPASQPIAAADPEPDPPTDLVNMTSTAAPEDLDKVELVAELAASNLEELPLLELPCESQSPSLEELTLQQQITESENAGDSDQITRLFELYEARTRIEAASSASALELIEEILQASEEINDKEDARNLFKKIKEMLLPHRIKLAHKATATARAILIRDANRQVRLAVLQNPHLQYEEIEKAARSADTACDVLEAISDNQVWMKECQLKKILVVNPKVPTHVAFRWLRWLELAELKEVVLDKNVKTTLRQAAQKELPKY